MAYVDLVRDLLALFELQGLLVQDLLRDVALAAVGAVQVHP